jgi:signal transduction histidine kinase
VWLQRQTVMMGGDIGVESAPGHGSTCTVRPPAAVAEAKIEVTPEPPLRLPRQEADSDRALTVSP